MGYEDNKSDNCSTCTSTCTCESCCESQDCGCKMELDTKCVRYTNYALECLNISEGDNLETILQKINTKVCDLTMPDCSDAAQGLYQMWLDLGNVGTIEDFLNSLKGADGTDGTDGTNGIDGTNGTDGVDGISIVWLGSFATAPLTPNLNEAYYNTTDGISYIWDGLAWQIISQDGIDGTNGTDGTNGVDGEKGADGTNGSDGLSFRQGVGVPPGGLGIDGDSYFNNDNCDVYQKVAGSWVLTGNLCSGGTGASLGYLFNAAKISTQVLQDGENSIITFSDDVSTGRFDEGGNWATDTFTAPYDITGAFFKAVVNIEVNDAVTLSNPINATLSVSKNGVGITTDVVNITSTVPDGTVYSLFVNSGTQNLLTGDTITYTLNISADLGGGTCNVTVLAGSFAYNN